MRLRTAVQHAASLFAAATPPRRRHRAVLLRRARRQTLHRAAAIGPVALQQLQQLQQLAQHRCSSTLSTSPSSTTAAATTAQSSRATALMLRSTVPVSVASPTSSAGASCDESVLRTRSTPSPPGSYTQVSGMASTTTTTTISTQTRGGQKRPVQHDPRGDTGALATPRSVADGSATRRAHGGRIDGGSDG